MEECQRFSTDKWPRFTLQISSVSEATPLQIAGNSHPVTHEQKILAYCLAADSLDVGFCKVST